MVYILDSDGPEPEGTEDDNSGSEETNDGEAIDETIGNLTSNIDRGDTRKDPVANQRFSRRRSQDLTRSEIEGLLDSNWIRERVVDDYAQYATKNGAEIKLESDTVEDEKLSELEERVEMFIESHDLMAALEEMIEEERGTGTGFLYPVVTEPQENSVDQELSGVKNIETFNVFGDLETGRPVVNLDPLSGDYKEIESVPVKFRGDVIETGRAAVEDLHSSRFIMLQTRTSKASPREGLSVFRRTKNLLKMFANMEWAIGQIIFRSVYKVLKTSLDQFDDTRQRNIAERELEREWDPMSLSIIGREDDMEMKSSMQNLGGAGAIFAMAKDLMSAGFGYPKSMLFGSQSGTLSASDRDAKNFFQGINGFQEAELTPVVKNAIRFGWMATGDTGIRTDGIEWDQVDVSVKWNDLFEVSEIDQAKVKSTEEQARSLAIQSFQRLNSMQLIDEETALEALQEAEFVPEGELPESSGLNLQGLLSGPIEEPSPTGPEGEGEEIESEPQFSSNGT